MAKFCNTIRFMIWAMFFGCAAMAFLGNIKTASGQCQGDVEGLMKECSKYVQKQGPKMSPSQGCCSVIKNVDLPCVCKHITDDVEKIISMEKSVYVAGICGKPLIHGTKCGSK